MAPECVTEFAGNLGVEGAITGFSAEDMISGDPDTTMWTTFSGLATSLISGIWESEAFKIPQGRPAMVGYFFNRDGLVRLPDKHSNSETFGPGHAVMIKPGFDGIWESLTKVRKHFFIGVC